MRILFDRRDKLDTASPRLGLSAKLLTASIVLLPVAETSWLAARTEQPWIWSELARASGRQLQAVADLDPVRDGPLAVSFVQDSGGIEVASVVADALEGDGTFVRGPSAHLIRAEPVQTWSSRGLRLHLWRRGWDVTIPELWVACPCPWLWAAAAGLCVFAARRPAAWAIAGILLQLAIWVLLGSSAWENESSAETVRLGYGGLEALLGRTGGDESLDYGLGAAAAALLGLGIWSARGSKRTELADILRPIWAVAAVLCWLEAAGTCGILAAWSQGKMVASAMALTVACGFAWMPRRRWPRWLLREAASPRQTQDEVATPEPAPSPLPLRAGVLAQTTGFIGDGAHTDAAPGVAGGATGDGSAATGTDG